MKLKERTEDMRAIAALLLDLGERDAHAALLSHADRLDEVISLIEAGLLLGVDESESDK